MESWANLVNPIAEDCHCIFQVAHGWFDVHDQWEYALEEKFTTEKSIEYFKGGNVVSRDLDGTFNDANHVLLLTIMIIKSVKGLYCKTNCQGKG